MGLAILNSQGQYRLILYVTRTQPVASLKVNLDFKVSLQKNNYVSFYDESKRLWSILFENEELVTTFNTQVYLISTWKENVDLNNWFRLDRVVQIQFDGRKSIDIGALPARFEISEFWFESTRWSGRFGRNIHCGFVVER